MRPARAIALLGLAGCSFGRNPTPCDDAATCREAFGLGSVCGDEGLCLEPSPPPRCAQTDPPDVFARPTNYAHHHVIGSLFDVSTDEPQVRSVQLAVGQVNDLDGLDGVGFVTVSCTYEENSEIDDLDPTAATVELMTYFTEVLGASAVVGPSSSDRSIDAYSVAEPNDAVVISPSATSPTLTTIDGDIHTDEAPGLFWRTAPPDDLQAATMVWDVESRGVTNVAVVAQESSYATALADAFTTGFSGTAVRFSFDNPTTLGEAITDAGNAGVQEVVFLSSEVVDIVSFFEAVAVSSDFNGADPVEVFLADAGADPFLLANTAELDGVVYDRVRGTRPKVPEGDVFEQFQTAFASRFGDDPADAVYAAYTYDAAWLAIYGHAWSTYQEGGVSGLGIARGLRRVSDPIGGILPVRPGSWEVVVEKFQAGTSLDLDGASGPLDFDPVTGETSAAIEVWVIDAAGTGFEAVTVCDPDGTCTAL